MKANGIYHAAYLYVRKLCKSQFQIKLLYYLLSIIHPLRSMSCKETFSMFGYGCFMNEETPFPPMPDEIKSKFQDQFETLEANFDIILNKYLNNHEITDVELQQLSETERNVLDQMNNKAKTKKKRTDECQKLFYKKAFKFSEHKFFKKMKNKSRKMSLFYHYHFDKVSSSSNLPLTSFYHPNKKTKPGLNTGQKTFNLTYVKLLLKSQSFRSDVKEYHRIFIEDCLKERQKKINSFKTSIGRYMNGTSQNSKDLIRYLQSSQCKIPWTMKEIMEVWEMAQRDLNNSSKDEDFADEPPNAEYNCLEMNYLESISLGESMSPLIL